MPTRLPFLFLALTAAAGLALVSGGCGSSDSRDVVTPPETELMDGLSFGDDTTVDIVTWNIQTFPRQGTDTVEYLAEAIRRIEPDLLALQEIESAARFADLLELLPDYDGHRANSASYDIDLAWIWRTAEVQVDTIYEIYRHDSYAFPRRPLVMECETGGRSLLLIGNHFKCCGDGWIGEGWDEELRRRTASDSLHAWVEVNAPERDVVILGDLNDKIDDVTSRNVFQTFLDDADHWRFADAPLVADQASWSWKLTSHIDHILVTDELFDDVDAPGASVLTIRVDQHLDNGMGEYQSMLSDHMPVGLRLESLID